MLRSREACIDYMMPLGLHHIFKFDHHYGPEPDGFIASYPLEWCPVYYHQADSTGIGFDRTHTGTDATSQYNEPYCSLYDDINTCPERYLLWFHHVPWDYRLHSGRTLRDELAATYAQGVQEAKQLREAWLGVKPRVGTALSEQRYERVLHKLDIQVKDAQEWHDVCLAYFLSFADGTCAGNAAARQG